MNNSPLYNTPAGTLIKTSLVDFPGHTAAAVFLKGCNIRCPYCYNHELVIEEEIKAATDFSTLNQIIDHLQKRRKVLTGLTVSGGEPLMNPLTEILIHEARLLGYKIKLDTNGTFPQKLKSLINNPELKPDYIAMDFKTTPERTHLLLPDAAQSVIDRINRNLVESIEILSSLPSDQREFRTVLVPGLVDENTLNNMAHFLPSNASWYLAHFRNENCLDPSWNDMTPYTDSQEQSMLMCARNTIKNTFLR